jgi:hypothetical protein
METMRALDRLRRAPAGGRWVVLTFAAALVTAAGCGPSIDARVIEDAHTAVRVKTALVNDAELGTRAIEVRVSRGVAQLSGVVESEGEAARAVALARTVAGVVRVDADLFVRPPVHLPLPGAGAPVPREPEP